MQVETFEVISNNPAHGDNALTDELRSGEAVEIIASLGLAGQEKLLQAVSEDSADTVVVRSPYRKMTIEEQRVYGTLMPTDTKLVDYASSPIPLRILQVAAHAAPMFEELRVWHPREVKEDPILVGVQYEKTTWGRTPTVFLLARWGDVLLPFEELREKAKAIIVRKIRDGANERIAEAQTALASLEGLANKHLDGGYVPAHSW